jgi:membrane protease YdiL (CAAX protease family)
MNPETAKLGPTLIKVIVPLVGVGFILFVAKRRQVSWSEGLGLARPAILPGLLWFGLYVTWMLGTNYFMNWRGPWDFTVWKQTPLLISILRVMAVALFGPISEELVFRGFLYSQLAHTKLKVAGAILITAAIWSVVHFSYSPSVIAVIFVAGLLLGIARLQSKSVIIPMLMHITWNLFAVW